MSYVEMLDRLLELADKEAEWSEHSEEYDDLYDRLMCVLMDTE